MKPSLTPPTSWYDVLEYRTGEGGAIKWGSRSGESREWKVESRKEDAKTHYLTRRRAPPANARPGQATLAAKGEEARKQSAADPASHKASCSAKASQDETHDKFTRMNADKNSKNQLSTDFTDSTDSEEGEKPSLGKGEKAKKP